MRTSEVQGIIKIANANIDADLVNWSWEYVNNNIKKKYGKKSAWIYFIAVDGIIRKVGGTGMALINRARFYQSANYWTDKPGYCNAATNPILFHYLQHGKKVELFAVIEDIPSLQVEARVNGKKRSALTNVDFRPFEGMWREEIEEFNIENNRINESLDLDGRALQITLAKLELNEVTQRINKRVPEGMTYIQEGKKWVLTKLNK